MKKFILLFFVIFLNLSYALEIGTPEFISLRSDEVNLRTGPGNEYPIKYVCQLKNMPLRVLGEYDGWYKIQDKDKEEAWVNKNLTTKKRTLIVVNGTQILYKKDNLKSNPIFRLEENVILKYEKCNAKWCKVEVEGKKGWIQSENIWGNI